MCDHLTKAAFGRNQISVQVSGFGFQSLGFADT
jgi:hypothetical protein